MERRCSAVTLGLTPLPPISSQNPSRRQSAADTWDYYYPGIQIIQPTPKTSPCPSEKSIIENRKIGRHKSLIEQESFECVSVYSSDDKLPATDKSVSTITTVAASNATNSGEGATAAIDGTSTMADTNYSQSSCSGSQPAPHPPHQHIIRRAPLASLSSFKISSIDYQDSDLKSLGSDSVFAESYADTDDEMEQFSTDSEESCAGAQSSPNTRTIAHHHPHYHHHHPQHMFSDSRGFSRGMAASAVVALPPSPLSVCGTLNEMKKLRGSGSVVRRANSGAAGDYVNRNYSKNILPKSSSVHLVNTFETEAIIERHPTAAIPTGSNATPIGKPTVNTAAPSSSSSSAPSAAATLTSIRPASYSGSHSLSNFSKQHSNQNSKINNKSSECVDINVVVVDNRSIVSPSVILELPVISTQEIVYDPPVDPSLPGASRKWSKETLF